MQLDTLHQLYDYLLLLVTDTYRKASCYSVQAYAEAATIRPRYTGNCVYRL